MNLVYFFTTTILLVGVLFSIHKLYLFWSTFKEMKVTKGLVTNIFYDIINEKCYKYEVSYSVDENKFISHFMLDFLEPKIQSNNLISVFYNRKNYKNIYLNTFFGFWSDLFVWIQYFLISSIALIYNLFYYSQDYNTYSINFNQVLLFIVLIISIFLLKVASKEMKKIILLFDKSLKAIGKIIDYETSEDSEKVTFYLPIIEFITSNKEKYVFKSKIGIYEKKEMGKSVMIIYNSRYPFVAEIDNKILILAPLLFIGIFFLSIIFYLLFYLG